MNLAGRDGGHKHSDHSRKQEKKYQGPHFLAEKLRPGELFPTTLGGACAHVRPSPCWPDPQREISWDETPPATAVKEGKRDFKYVLQKFTKIKMAFSSTHLSTNVNRGRKPRSDQHLRATHVRLRRGLGNNIVGITIHLGILLLCSVIDNTIVNYI